jgi:hypothetical protein
MPAWGFGHVDRLRRRLAWLLVRPYVRRRMRYARARIEAGHQPESYDADWWEGQWFALAHLSEDLRWRSLPELPVVELPASRKGSY